MTAKSIAPNACLTALTRKGRKSIRSSLSEWDYYPSCAECGTVHEYVSLTEDGYRHEMKRATY